MGTVIRRQTLVLRSTFLKGSFVRIAAIRRKCSELPHYARPAHSRHRSECLLSDHHALPAPWRHTKSPQEMAAHMALIRKTGRIGRIGEA